MRWGSQMNSEIIQPVVVLVAWTTVMWAWMYATRIPAVAKMRMRLDANIPKPQQMNELPARVRWKADNYNHLMEQPTIFYAVALSLALLGAGDGLNALLAWGYVGLRVVHSLFQALVNKIEIRFAIFSLSGVVLAVLVARALMVAF